MQFNTIKEYRVARKRLIERTDGRRKGYQAHRSTVAERLDERTKAKLEALRDGSKSE